jgi:hypothetical protein
MKGVKTVSHASSSSKRFQSDEIHAGSIITHSGLNLIETVTTLVSENKKLKETVDNLTSKLKEVDDKVNSFEAVTE